MFDPKDIREISAMANQIGKDVTAVARISATIADLGEDSPTAVLLNAERQNYCDGAMTMMEALAKKIDGGGKK